MAITRRSIGEITAADQGLKRETWRKFATCRSAIGCALPTLNTLEAFHAASRRVVDSLRPAVCTLWHAPSLAAQIAATFATRAPPTRTACSNFRGRLRPGVDARYPVGKKARGLRTARPRNVAPTRRTSGP
jgi:hypothetical protein